MGKTGINLLNTKSESLPKNKLLGKLKQASILFLIAYIVITVGVLSAHTIIDKRANDFKKNIVSAESKIKSLQKTEELEIALKERIKVIDQITDKTIDVNEILNKIRTVTSMSGVILGDLTINEKSISLSASATDEQTLRNLLNQLKTQGNIFSRIEIGPFSRDKTGKYNFPLMLMI